MPQQLQDDISITRMIAESQAWIDNLLNEQSQNEEGSYVNPQPAPLTPGWIPTAAPSALHLDPPHESTPFHLATSVQPPAAVISDSEVEHSYLTPVARVLQVQSTLGQTSPPIQGASSLFRGPYPAIGRSQYPSTLHSLFPLPHIPGVIITSEPERPLQRF